MVLSSYCRRAVMTSIWKCLPFALVWLVTNAGATAPGVLITNLPAYNTLLNVSGLVYGTNSASLAVAVFVYVPGYGWVTQPDRRYQFGASSNLLEWEDLGTILATNVVINFPDWTHLGLDQCFYRAAALP